MHIFIKNKKLILDKYRIKCAIGKRGIGNKKREGDKITPKGKFKIKTIMYRKDRESHFKSKITKLPIKRNMGWCDDPYNKKYNKEIFLNKKNKGEKLFRRDNSYDILIVIEYNTKKVQPFKGSAIFIHLTKNYKPTQGCIALKKNDLLILLKIIDKKSKIKIC